MTTVRTILLVMAFLALAVLADSVTREPITEVERPQVPSNWVRTQ